MRERQLAGRSVPCIGQGTWLIENDKEAVQALRRGIDLGLTHIDTAEMYGEGAAEAVVAEAIAGRRQEVFITSKVLPANASYTGIVQACERSLQHLKSDYLDLYLLHWPSVIPLADTVGAFEELILKGKIRAWGVSNFDVAQLEELWLVGAGRVACNQVVYHLLDRAVEHDLLPWCLRHGLPLVGYSPFGQGNFPPLLADGDALSAIAEARGATRRQVALAFLTHQAGTFTIPKAGRVEHTEENAGALGVELTTAQVTQIDAAYPLSPGQRLGLL